ncbi:MAG: type II toxin-antitoxin system RelE/ParE family toxin [Neisseria sp.]|nr:type II toxin-antitoxin system RelE/ParE family toxin [Neisseria sp.]
MKKLAFIGDSLNGLRSFPADTKQQAGYQLHKVQSGEMPTDFKTMPTIGSGVIEIRLKDQIGIYRVIYTAKIADTVYVLHAFQKKTQKTAKSDIELAKKRHAELLKGLK